MQRGCLITLEGIEGAGKTTHIGAIGSTLRSWGIEAVITREPGGTKLGERLRDFLLAKESIIGAEAELLMLFAARSELIRDVVCPALDKGQWVISDRFTDSSYAYQGGGRNCELQLLDALNATICKDIYPDLTILFDVKPEVARARIVSRGEKDRFDFETDTFFESVQRTYLAMAEADPSRWRIICANRKASEVQADVVSCINEFMNRRKVD